MVGSLYEVQCVQGMSVDEQKATVCREWLVKMLVVVLGNSSMSQNGKAMIKTE